MTHEEHALQAHEMFEEAAKMRHLRNARYRLAEAQVHATMAVYQVLHCQIADD